MEPVPAAVHVTLQGARRVGLEGCGGSSACGVAAALSGRLLCWHGIAQSTVCVHFELLQ